MSPSRCSVFLVVRCISGTIWKCPIDLIATEPHKDNAIIIESTEVGKTSAVGIRLTSTTRFVSVLLSYEVSFIIDVKIALLHLQHEVCP